MEVKDKILKRKRSRKKGLGDGEVGEEVCELSPTVSHVELIVSIHCLQTET